MANTPTPYTYWAQVESVYDGDSLWAVLDLGMSLSMRVSCRLNGIDTPEIRTKNASEKEAAYTARDRVRDLVEGKQVKIQSIAKPDKYGRLLVELWTEDGTHVNQLLVDEGLARPYDGGTKVPYDEWPTTPIT